MKVKQVVNVLGAITDTGKLACDMYDLDKKEYYSDAQAEYIPIAEMDFQHLVRAFIKQLAKEKTNHCNTVDIVHAKDSIIKKLRKDLQGRFKQSVDDLDRLDAQEKIIAGLRSQVETLEGIIEEKDELIDRWSKAEHRWRKAYHDSAHTNGHYYTFCEVPQDEEGKEFIKNCKKYLNKESYTIRVRGQHLKKDLYGQGRASWGANMEDSTHMRVYIDKKKGDK
jgi:uncharacterized protein YlxP (DUF503 family)